jgi:hypothetical protein
VGAGDNINFVYNTPMFGAAWYRRKVYLNNLASNLSINLGRDALIGGLLQKSTPAKIIPNAAIPRPQYADHG